MKEEKSIEASQHFNEEYFPLAGRGLRQSLELLIQHSICGSPLKVFMYSKFATFFTPVLTSSYPSL